MLCVFPLAALLLGWALLALVRPDLLRDALFPPPDWITDPARQWLRWLLVSIAGTLFLLALIPVGFLFVVILRDEPKAGLMCIGAVLAGASLVEETRRDAPEKTTGWMPVHGRWRRPFLLIVGLLLIGLGIWTPRFG
jgi:hypothetical protein